MPFQSEKQRRYLWANEPEVAREWTNRYGALNGGIMDVGSNGNVRHDFENYASGGGNVSVPTSFQARPHSDPVNLAYVTPQEQGLLQNLKPGTPHHGPMGIPNYDSFDAAGGYSNPDTGYAASSGGGGGGWQDTSTQDRRQEQQWQATSDAIKKAEKQKKLIKYGDKGLDAYTLLNAIKTGGWKYNPATHGLGMFLGMLGKRNKGIGALPHNLVDEETIDFTSMSPGPHWNLPTFSEGVPQAFESGPAGVLGDQTGIQGLGNNLMAGPIGNYAQQAVANQVLGQSYGTLDPFQQQQVDDAINTYGTTSTGTLRG
jgi:hypothetical protein